MTDLEEIRQLHARCGCVSRTGNANHKRAVALSFNGCRLEILGLRLVIECDKCTAFGQDETKPDLLVLRQSQNGHEWIVIEIKSIMDAGAKRQVQAGIDKLNTSSMFAPSRPIRCRGLFASKKANRTADVDALRQSLFLGRQRVLARIERCGNGKRL